MKNRTPLIAGAALGVAALVGYGVARMTQPSAPVADDAVESATAEPAGDTVAVADANVAALQIGIAKASSGELDAVIAASATVEAAPEGEAVLTARAPGVVSRIFKRIGDSVQAGETLALVESRDAAAISADRAVAAARVTLAQRRLSRERQLLSQGVSPRADYESAQAELAVAQADAQRAAASAAGARVTRDGRSVAVVTPIAGRVTATPANLGQFVSAETELFRIADTRRLLITASLSAGEAQRVRTGDKAELITAEGVSIEGRVRSATGVVDPNSRAVLVVIEPVAVHALLAPGQLMRARIFASAGAASNTVMVPQDAVQTVGSRSVVFVRTAAGFKAQTVQAGRASGGLVAITSGLAAGTPIATTNAFLLKAELEKETAE